MKRRYHRWYSRTYSINERLTRALTVQGQSLFIVAFALMFFGLNTRVSMLYNIFAITVALLIIDRISLFFRMPPVRVLRYSPGNIVKGKTAKYRVAVQTKESYLNRNNLFYQEIPADPRPDYDTFVFTPEPGEKKRNWYDRKMGYYRWKWIINRNLGAQYPEFTASIKKRGDEAFFDIKITPLRRGKVRLSASFVFVKGIFGLFKKGKVVENPGQIIVFPQIFSMDKIDLIDGARDSTSEKTRETEETGRGYELKSLREYVPGDSPRFIHWKSSAKTGKLKIREHHKEVDAGTVLFLDTFISDSYSDNFEGAVSLVASLLEYFSAIDMMPNMVAVGDNIYEIDSNTQEIFQEIMVVLALVETERKKKITEVFPLLSKAGSESGSIFFVTPLYNDERHEMLMKLNSLGIKVFPLYFGNRNTTLELIENETGIDPENLEEEFAKL